mmetsp:Transcript_31407/g.79616  ORF Transcript_31407/g.79616 Transcript_31407/m.79616 type:complete len:255 (-) Transcript_31407:223-987(-)
MFLPWAPHSCTTRECRRRRHGTRPSPTRPRRPSWQSSARAPRRRRQRSSGCGAPGATIRAAARACPCAPRTAAGRPGTWPTWAFTSLKWATSSGEPTTPSWRWCSTWSREERRRPLRATASTPPGCRPGLRRPVGAAAAAAATPWRRSGGPRGEAHLRRRRASRRHRMVAEVTVAAAAAVAMSAGVAAVTAMGLGHQRGWCQAGARGMMAFPRRRWAAITTVARTRARSTTPSPRLARPRVLNTMPSLHLVVQR